MAQAIVSQARIFGGDIGIAMTTAVLGRSAAPRAGWVGSFVEGSEPESGSDAASLSPPLASAVRLTYVDAFSMSTWVTAIFAGVGVPCALTMDAKTVKRKGGKERTGAGSI